MTISLLRFVHVRILPTVTPEMASASVAQAGWGTRVVCPAGVASTGPAADMTASVPTQPRVNTPAASASVAQARDHVSRISGDNPLTEKSFFHAVIDLVLTKVVKLVKVSPRAQSLWFTIIGSLDTCHVISRLAGYLL